MNPKRYMIKTIDTTEYCYIVETADPKRVNQIDFGTLKEYSKKNYGERVVLKTEIEEGLTAEPVNFMDI